MQASSQASWNPSAEQMSSSAATPTPTPKRGGVVRREDLAVVVASSRDGVHQAATRDLPVAGGSPAATAAAAATIAANAVREAVKRRRADEDSEAVVVASKAGAAKKPLMMEEEEVYLVNRQRFQSTATEEELGRREQLFSLDGGSQTEVEDMHRIIQCKIRYGTLCCVILKFGLFLRH